MAENILETIAAKRRIYIEEKKKQVPLKNLISQAEALLQKEEAGEVSAKPSFYDSLAGDKLSFICEVKKAVQTQVSSGCHLISRVISLVRQIRSFALYTTS